ncbi:hypothetical protein P692DRAFT_20417057 [Suillus brevipes Sb2]|nr:hypothetical protein P692DRAFT_20417057 [Suillus brevipes Sb2]
MGSPRGSGVHGIVVRGICWAVGDFQWVVDRWERLGLSGLGLVLSGLGLVLSKVGLHRWGWDRLRLHGCDFMLVE